MPWIHQIEPDVATGPLREIYENITGARGKVANIIKVHSLNPKAMRAHMDLYLSIMFDRGGLSRQECEMIGVVVSAANGCNYCVNHHAAALNAYWKDDDKLKRFMDDPESVELSERVAAMLAYAVKLTRTPAAMVEHDVERFRRVGLNDEQVLNVALIAAYFNFVNRVALGLGVEFNDREVEGYRY